MTAWLAHVWRVTWEVSGRVDLCANGCFLDRPYLVRFLPSAAIRLFEDQIIGAFAVHTL